MQNSLVGDPGAKDAWLGAGMDYDLAPRAANVAVPITVVVGGNDVVETEDALCAAFDLSYTGTRYVIIKGSGHLFPLQAATALAAAISDAADKYCLPRT